MNKKNIFTLIGFCVSILFLIISIRLININELKDAFLLFGYKNAILAGLLYLVNFFVRGLRSHFLLASLGSISYRLALDSVIISYGLNNILPAKGGDIYRLFFLKRYSNINKSSSMGILFTERIFDALVLVSLLLVSLFFIGGDKVFPQDQAKTIYTLSALLLIAGVSFMLCIVFFEGHFMRAIRFIVSHRSIVDKIDNFVNSFSYIKKPKAFLLVLFLSFLIWIVEGYVFTILLDNSSAFVGLCWMSLLALSFLLPAAPGNFGLYEWVSMIFLTAIGYSRTEAFSLGILAHMSQFIPITLIAILLLQTVNFSNYFGRKSSANS